MRAKSLALLILALGCGLVASIGITQVMATRDAAPPIAEGDAVTIFVAMEDIGLGEPLTPQVLRLEQWPKDKIPSGALTKIEDIEGRRTKNKLFAGEPVLENKLLPKGVNAQGISTTIPEGYRVIPVKVDTGSGGAGLILPGDRVDVSVFLRITRAARTSEGVQTILEDIKVFAVNAVVGIDGDAGHEKSISAKTISLLVTPKQANKLILAAELGKIRLVMRSPIDTKPVEGSEVSRGDLVGVYAAADREQEERAQQGDTQKQAGDFLDFLKQANQQGTSEAAVPERATIEMRLLRGSEVEIVSLEQLSDSSISATPFGWRQNSLLSGGGFDDTVQGAPEADGSDYDEEAEPAEDEDPDTDSDEPAEEEEPETDTES